MICVENDLREPISPEDVLTSAADFIAEQSQFYGAEVTARAWRDLVVRISGRRSFTIVGNRTESEYSKQQRLNEEVRRIAKAILLKLPGYEPGIDHVQLLKELLAFRDWK